MDQKSTFQTEPSEQSSGLSVCTMLTSLLQDDRFCDVVFRVGVREQVEDIKAHRSLLASRSSVFTAMLYGSLLETRAVIEVTDIMPDIFSLMKKFIYKDSIEGINADNIIELYYAANKYEVVRLKEICAQKVKELMSMEKIGDFLEMMDLYDDPVITRDCSSFVSTNAWKLFQNEQYFTNLSLKHLCYIWRHDIDFKGRNKLPELHIYVGAIKWAKAECVRQQLTPLDPVNLRRVLGDAFGLLCYPRMSLDEFYTVVRKDGLFTSDEVAAMTFYMANVDRNALPPFGRAAPAGNTSRTDHERVRLWDGQLVYIRKDLLQAAIAGKPSTCGCDCEKIPKIRCAFQKNQLEVANKHSCQGQRNLNVYGHNVGYVQGNSYRSYSDVNDKKELSPKLE